MNVAMLIPTGLNCAIGGHSGDATPVAKLLASVCDTLLVHPNVVNAGDIIDMPPNAWYVPGQMLDYVIKREHGITEPKHNRIIVVYNEPMHVCTMNAINAASHVLGVFTQPVGLDIPITMRGWVEGGGAYGEFSVGSLYEQIHKYEYDAIAIHTPIEVDREYAERYQTEGGVNPWGKVEAMLSAALIEELGVPVAHAPVPPDEDACFIQLHRRLAAEGVSGSYLMSVIKGLSHCPRIDNSRFPLDFLVVPAGLERKFPVPTIRVTENVCVEDCCPIGDGPMVNNYLEAAAWISAKRVGVDPLMCLVR